MSTTTLESVRHYYGDVLQRSADLQTGACCSTETMPKHVREIVNAIDAEVLERFYGCGSPIPDAIEGATVLDLGCGTGRDVFIASRLAGPEGLAIGIDMTPAQLEVANRNRESQARAFGYDKPNTAFIEGYIEDLAGAGIEDNSIDVVISNCVINLSPDKSRVFEEIFRVLKPGGELLFSDVFADRRVPRAAELDPVVYGECLGGALYEEDFRRMMMSVGCPDYRVLSRSAIEIDNVQIRSLVGETSFHSLTVRAFKLGDLLEDQCEDYGQVATYRGTIPFSPSSFALDPGHKFEAWRPERVCGNTAAMVQNTRYAKHFEILGDRTRHFGLFPCGPTDDVDEVVSGSCC